jgi:hypothetical protein
MFSQEYNHPPFLVKSVATSGITTSQIPFAQVGLFAQSTYTPVNTNTLAAEDFVFFATGSFHTTDSLGAYNQGLKQSMKSIFFRPIDVLEIRKSAPIAAVNETMILGWDGISGSTCQSLSFSAGSTYRFQVRAWGEDVYSTYLHPVVRTFTLITECDPSPNCSTGCVGTALPVDVYTKKMVNLINNDPELQKFVYAEAIFNNVAASSATFTSWTLTLADNGDQLALAAVQAFYAVSGYTVSQASYNSPYSTYTITIAAGVTPSGYTATSSVNLANCNGTCPSGYTLTNALDVYYIHRPLSASDNLSTVSARTAYASSVNSQYDAIPAVSGVAYAFQSYNTTEAIVMIAISAGTSFTPLSADTIQFISTRPATCTSPSAASVAWTSGVNYYQASRTLCLTLPKPCGTGTSNLSTLRAYYANNTTISATSIAVSGTSSCSEQFYISQRSNFIANGCDTTASATFDELPPYQGIRWTACPCTTDSSINTSGATLAGIKITTAYQTPEFGPSFLPTDYYNVKPFHIDVQQIDDSGNACQSFWANKTLNKGIMATQTGHYVAREYAQAMAYQAYSDIFQEVRMQEVLDQLWFKTAIDKTASYTIYYIKLRQYRDMSNSVRDYSPEIFEYPFIIKNGDDTAAFENYIMGIFSKFGKNLLIK